MATQHGGEANSEQPSRGSWRQSLVLRLGGPALALWFLCLLTGCLVTLLMFLPFNIYLRDGELQIYRKVTPTSQPSAVALFATTTPDATSGTAQPAATPAPASTTVLPLLTSAPSASAAELPPATASPAAQQAMSSLSGRAATPTPAAPPALAASPAPLISPAAGAISVASVTQLAPALTLEQAGYELAWSPDGALLAVAERGVVLFDAGGRPVRTLGEQDARGVAFSPDSATLAAIQREVILYDVKTGSVRLKLPRLRIDISPTTNQFLAWTPDGSALAVIDREIVRFFSPIDGAMTGIIPANGPSAIAFSPDGRALAAAGGRGLRLYDTETLKETLSVRGAQTTSRLAYSRDGAVLYGAGLFATQLWAWQTADGALLWSWKDDATFSGRVLALSPDGSLLATVSDDVRVRLFDAARGQPAHELLAHSQSVNGIAFSPDGTALATTSSDGSTIVWRIGN